MEVWKQAEVAYESAIAPAYDALYYGSPVQQRHLDRFVSLVRRHTKRDQPLLDLGGGTGMVTERLLAKEYRQVVTADVSLAMLREAKQKVPAMRAVVCDGERLPFKDEVFQTVVCSSMLHHLPFPDRVLAAAKHTMRPYGVLVAQEPNQRLGLARPDQEKVNALTTSVMHYLYRVEQYRPASEPAVHEYHRAFTRQELLDLFLGQMFILEFSSEFAFSSLFTKLKSPVLSRAVCALDRTLRGYEGSVFYVVASKTDWGHRNILRDYFQYVEQIRAEPTPQRSLVFMAGLLPLIVIGRLYEMYERVRSRLRESG